MNTYRIKTNTANHKLYVIGINQIPKYHQRSHNLWDCIFHVENYTHRKPNDCQSNSTELDKISQVQKDENL